MLVPGSPTTRWTVVPNGASTTGAKYPGFDTLGSVNTRPASVTMLPLLAITVTAALPLCPSLVAVMLAVPAALPVTSPLVLTVATAALPLAHATARPVSTLPAASLGVATSCTVLPSFTLAGAGVTVTDATGTCTTVMAAVP